GKNSVQSVMRFTNLSSPKRIGATVNPKCSIRYASDDPSTRAGAVCCTVAMGICFLNMPYLDFRLPILLRQESFALEWWEMKDLTPSEALEAVSALAEPARRALYEYVAAAPDAVGRDQAAEAVGVSRQAAAYHLDRLADDGLLSVEYRRLTGR